MNLNEKIPYLVKKINIDMFEREEVIKLAFLSLLSGESIFLLGLPGVAKSMIARRIKNALVESENFEYLMNRFSSPEEIFGPVSLKKLEEDKYERVVEGYLPTANVAFLDEIWKASPAIQNTLLTIINEKIFRNGAVDIKVPLKLLISASNELPLEGEGLEALYDRFLIRYYVEPIKDEDNFNKLISLDNQDTEIEEQYKLSNDDLQEVLKSLEKVIISKDIFNFINSFRKEIAIKMKNKAPYISDRRWKKIVAMMKINASISNRHTVSAPDLLIILHAVWEHDKQRNAINNIFSDLFNDFITLKTGSSLKEIENNVTTAKELFKIAYKKVEEQISQTATDPVSGKTLKYYLFEYMSKNNYWWIPLKGGKIVIDNANRRDRTYIYYNDYKSKKINPSNYDAIDTTYFELNDDGNATYDRKVLKALIEKKEIKDVKKLKEIKRNIDNNSLLVSNLLNQFKFEYDLICLENSGLVHQFSWYMEKANAAIKDKISKANSDNNFILGEVVSNLK